MKTIIHRVCLALSLGMISVALFAQEKNQSYYYRHQNEILPDANQAFQEGNYDRTIDLCLWHYIIVGDKTADSLREKAERCAKLSKEMADLQAAGKTTEAIEAARALLSINSNDTGAKELLKEIEKASEPIPVDTVVVNVPVTTDTVITEKPLQESPINDVTQEPAQLDTQEIVAPSTNTRIEPATPPTPQPRTRFVIKAGATVLDLKQFAQTIAPGGSLGIYEIGGSPVGMEAGFYLCPGLSAQSASLFGVDASLVFRVAKGIYPKVGLGFLSCSSTSGSDAATKGLCAGLGLTFLVGEHFCIDIGAKYYPTVKLHETEMVSTSGVSYEFPTAVQLIAGGIAPMVSIGWAF